MILIKDILKLICYGSSSAISLKSPTSGQRISNVFISPSTISFSSSFQSVFTQITPVFLSLSLSLFISLSLSLSLSLSSLSVSLPLSLSVSLSLYLSLSACLSVCLSLAHIQIVKPISIFSKCFFQIKAGTCSLKHLHLRRRMIQHV